MKRNISQILFRVCVAGTVAWFLFGSILVAKEAFDRVSKHQEQIVAYNAALQTFEWRCRTELAKPQRPEVQSQNPAPPRNIFESALDDVDVRYQRSSIVSQCISEDRAKHKHEWALFSLFPSSWLNPFDADAEREFRPEPLGYLEAVAKTDALFERLVFFLLAPIAILFVGRATKAMWRSILQKHWNSMAPESRFLIFGIVMWLVFYPLSVYFFEPSFLEKSDNPERMFFGYWIFLPVAISILWLGYRQILHKSAKINQQD